MNCYNCDNLLESNWNYCPNCKRKLKKKANEEEYVSSDEVGKCHTCSCELNDKWNFCPRCGTSVDFYSEKPNIVLPTIATNTDKKVVILEDDVVKTDEKKDDFKETEVVNQDTNVDNKQKNQWYKMFLFPFGTIMYVLSKFLGYGAFYLLFIVEISIPSFLKILLFWGSVVLYSLVPLVLELYSFCCFIVGGILLLLKKKDNDLTFLAFLSIIIRVVFDLVVNFILSSL